MSYHLKRLVSPKSWGIGKKASVWVTKPSPGAHSVESGVPALVVLRDLLGVCDTAREARRIVGNRDMVVDGRAVKNYKTPVGLMDVVSLPKMKANYRIVLSDKGKLVPVPISDKDAAWKLCRIEGKTKVKGGKIQLNLHDGRNIILDSNDYATGDVLKINVADQKIVEAYPMKGGASALICSGKQAGRSVVVKDYVVVKGPGANVVVFDDGSETVKRNVFVIGGKKPAIALPEGDSE